MDSPGPPDPPGPASPRGVAARLRLGAGAVVLLLLLALAAAVLVSLLTPTGASATLGSPAAPPGAAREAPTDPRQPEGDALPATPAAASGGGAAPPRADAHHLLVHVLGAVARPGLFELTPGARVVDAVAAAGGLAPAADQSRINLARAVVDGEQLYVPAAGEALPVAASPPGAAPDAGATATVVNLNTATVSDLDTLPRIGPELAQRILDWRTANGRFGAAEDLLEVPGIGDRTFEGLRERVTV